MNLFIKLLLLCGLLLNAIILIQCHIAQCPANELYYNATLSPMCDANCQDLQRRCPLTFFRPVAGCYCRPNYARNLQQRCIPRWLCVSDCTENETPIVPLVTDCEYICRTLPTGLMVSICYRRQERRCVCSLQYCRNRRGQCVKNIY